MLFVASLVITLLDVPAPASMPEIVKDEAACGQVAGTGSPPVIVARTAKIGGVVVETLHECGMSDEESFVRFDKFLVRTATIEYTAANMTDAPLHITLVRERIERGTLADGSRAIVASVDTEHARRCMKDGCGHDGVEQRQDVTVCTLPVDGKALCGSVDLVCKPGGCRAPKLQRGVLTVFRDRGRAIYNVAF